MAFPVRNGDLDDPRAHVPAQELRATQDALAPEDRRRAGEILEDVDPDVRRWLGRHRTTLTDSLRAQLDADGAAARRREDERYRQRQGEVSALIEQSTITRLEREIDELNARAAQGVLFDEAGRLASIEEQDSGR